MRMTSKKEAQVVVLNPQLFPFVLFLKLLLSEGRFIGLLHRGWCLEQLFDFIF